MIITVCKVKKTATKTLDNPFTGKKRKKSKDYIIHFVRKETTAVNVHIQNVEIN